MIKSFVKSLLVKDPKGRPTAKECMSHHFLRSYVGKSEANRELLRRDLCSQLKTVDIRQEISVPNQDVLIRADSGQVLPVDTAVDENGRFIYPDVDGTSATTTSTSTAVAPDAKATHTPTDISVNELSRQLADLSSTDDSTTARADTELQTPTRKVATDAVFTEKFTDRAVSHFDHSNTDKSLEVMKGLEEAFDDVERPPPLNQNLARLEILHDVAALVLKEQVRRYNLLKEVEPLPQFEATAQPNNVPLPKPASTTSAEDEENVPQEPTAEEEAALVEKLAKKQREAAAQKQAADSQHADLQDLANFENEFSGI